jgi:hypothetical protein
LEISFHTIPESGESTDPAERIRQLPAFGDVETVFLIYTGRVTGISRRTTKKFSKP